MAKPPSKETLQGLLLGAPMPLLPKQHCTDVEEDNWKRELYEYLKRLLGFFTSQNIESTIINGGGTTSSGGPYGFGPVKIDVFADTNVTNGGLFNGTKVGTVFHTSIFVENMENWPGIQPLQNPNCASVRVQARVVSPMTGDITFTLSSDDGARFYVNNVLAVDSWGATPGTFDYVYTATLGELINIKVEAENSGGGATFSARITWVGSGITTSSPKLSELRPPV